MARRPRLLFRALAALFGLAVALAGVEVAFHLQPRLLPAAFRDAYPLHGVDFFDRTVLDRTPIDSVPLPLHTAPFVGPPPTDLVDLGVAPWSERVAVQDREIEIPVDARGLPNRQALDQADVLLLGDSFVYGMGVVRPEALRLQQALGCSVYNVGIPGIGPQQAASVLEALAKQLRPKVVVWFVFGGNDLQDAARIDAAAAAGARTLADRELARAPRLIVPTLAAWWAGGLELATPVRAADASVAPHPGVEIAAPGQPPHRLWFLPHHVRLLGESRADVQAGPGFASWSASAARIAATTAAAGARLLVVYLPTKVEMVWPFVAAEQFAAVVELAAFGGPAPPADQLPELRQRVEANRGAFAALVAERCAELGVRHLDATPILRAAFAAGQPCYMAADTHLGADGQAALREPLAAACTALFAH